MGTMIAAVISCAGLLVALSYGDEVVSTSEGNILSTTVAASPVTAAVEVLQSSSDPPQPSEPPVVVTSETPQEEQPEPEEPTTPRRRITYDQRQDGHYNIRADLENFMIIVVPPNPAVGANLLDLLAQSGLKRSSTNKLPKKHIPFTGKTGLRRIDDFKASGYIQHLQQRQSPDAPVIRSHEFIEGRTPYSVDISSADHEVGHIHNDPQIEMLPPQHYPMHVRHISPAESYSSSPQHSKLLELLSHFSERRFPKAISNLPINIKEIHTNRVLSANEARSYEGNQNNDRASYTLAYQTNPFAVKPFVGLADSSSLPLEDDLELNGGRQYEPRPSAILGPIDRNWELKLIGATEQCGPGRRRNSYGICQFVPDVI